MRRTMTMLALASMVATLILAGCEDKSTDPQDATWQSLTDSPHDVYWGGAMFWDGGDGIYALEGDTDLGAAARDESKGFARYDISTNGWTDLAETLQDPGWSASLTGPGSGPIYCLVGNGSNNLLAYDVGDDSWSLLAEPGGMEFRHCGNALVWPGGGDYLYAVQGDGTDDFLRYDVTMDAWEMLDPVPTELDWGNSIAWGGGDLVFATGTDTTFWCYDYGDTTWTEKARCPDGFAAGGWLCFDGDSSLYAILGGGRPDLWRYDIAEDAWEQLEDAPTAFEGGAAIVSDGDAIYARPGGGSPEFWVFK